MADCSTIDARLAEARSAYHALQTGEAVSRVVDQNGESIQYTRAGLVSLTAYIRSLENEKAECAGNVGPLSGYRGPIRFTFGRRC